MSKFWHARRTGFRSKYTRPLPSAPTSTADRVVTDSGDNIKTDDELDVKVP